MNNKTSIWITDDCKNRLTIVKNSLIEAGEIEDISNGDLLEYLLNKFEEYSFKRETTSNYAKLLDDGFYKINFMLARPDFKKFMFTELMKKTEHGFIVNIKGIDELKELGYIFNII